MSRAERRFLNLNLRAGVMPARLNLNPQARCPDKENRDSKNELELMIIILEEPFSLQR
jgi:hypothetical protein